MTNEELNKVVEISNGNPEAITAIRELQHNTGDTFTCESLDFLQSHEILGTDIYVLWSDKCGKNMNKFHQLLNYYRYNESKVDRLIALAKDQRYQTNISDDEWAIIYQWHLDVIKNNLKNIEFCFEGENK